MIQLHRLEGFHLVAKTGGFARAARAFPYPITQPAVHQQVRKLQEELGVELFERVGKDRMMLTPAGARLHAYVGPFLDGLPAVVRAVRSGEHGGELNIHAEPMLLRRLLPKWLKRLERKCPDVHIELRELTTTDTAPLRRGDADLLVGYLPDLPDDIASQTVAVVRPYLVAPATRAKTPTLRALRDEPFVAYTRDQLAHDLQLQALAQNGIEPPRFLYASTADTILGFIESGLGYSLVPALDGQVNFGPGITSKPLNRPKIEFPIVAAWRKDTPENRMLDAALETAPSL
ncbi:MAG: LysR family transcriptional regulator [Planctomycetes bacterium]|nr:LysR family transcriptional regulator [Planctomycetota bacterium]